MSTSPAEIADFIQQFVKQQNQQGAVGKLTGEKEYKSVESGSRYHFIIGLVIDSGSKTVQISLAIQQIWHEQEDREKQSFSLFEISDGEQTCHVCVVLKCKLELCLRALTS